MDIGHWELGVLTINWIIIIINQANLGTNEINQSILMSFQSMNIGRFWLHFNNISSLKGSIFH